MSVMWLPRVARTGATPASDVLLLKSFEMSLKYSIYEIASKKIASKITMELQCKKHNIRNDAMLLPDGKSTIWMQPHVTDQIPIRIIKMHIMQTLNG